MDRLEGELPRWMVLQRQVELGLEKDLLSRQWTRRHSLERCLDEIPLALHPRLQQVWLVLAVQGYGERAIAGLIALLSHSNQEVAEAAAWGLSRLGRIILPDLRDRWESASVLVRDRICQILCYLGVQARGAESWLGSHQTEWSRTLCYRLQEFGWRTLVAWRVKPVWINQDSLQALAALAFGHDLDDRLYAVEALEDRGPGTKRLLRTLLGEGDEEVAWRALQCMERLGLEPGDAALRQALLSEDRRLRIAVMGRYVGGELGDMALEPLIYQKALLRMFDHGDDSWRLRALSVLSEQGVVAPRDAERLLPWLAHKDPQLRRLSVAAYGRMAGSPQGLEFLLEDSLEEVCLTALGLLVRQQCWGPILAHLGRKAVLRVVAEGYLMLQALERVDQVHLLQLRALGRDEDEELRDLSTRVLAQLDLERVRWKNWNSFNECQLGTALGLMRLHGVFPEGLKSLFLQGAVEHLQVWKNWLSRTDLNEVREALRGHLSSALPGSALVALRGRGKDGWDLLLEWVEGPQHLALEAVFELRRWMGEEEAAREWMLERGPQLLEGVTCEPVCQALAAAVGQTLLHQSSPVQERKLPWAVELATRNGSAVAALGYLQRAGADVLDQVLQRALEHPQVGVRMLAVSILRRSRRDCADLFRLRPPDPDRQVRLRVLSLLQEQGGLQAEELDELRGMAGEMIEARNLLARIEWEGP
ncbi:hypothetical protein IV102_17805 [bacterium]|nr:hypothetical protein [bacterium]